VRFAREDELNEAGGVTKGGGGGEGGDGTWQLWSACGEVDE
jgi:hypothetical protein